MAQVSDVTALLVAWGKGEERRGATLMDAVYGELRRLARGYLRRERLEHSLPPTALVHEAYLKLVDQRRVRWQNRAHFFGDRGARDAPHPGRSRARASRGQARRRRENPADGHRGGGATARTSTYWRSTRLSKAGRDRCAPEPRWWSSASSAVSRVEETAAVLGVAADHRQAGLGAGASLAVPGTARDAE